MPALWRVNTPPVQSREPRAGSLTVEKSKEAQGAVNPPPVGGDKRGLWAKIIGIRVSTSEKKTPTEAGYAQELQAGDNSSKPQGIEPDVSSDRSRPTEAGYSQGQAGENLLAGSQEIEPDVSSNRSRPTEAGYSQGTAGYAPSERQEIEPDVSSGQSGSLDNTNIQSVQQKLLDEVENLTAKRDRLIEDGKVQLSA